MIKYYSFWKLLLSVIHSNSALVLLIQISITLLLIARIANYFINSSKTQYIKERNHQRLILAHKQIINKLSQPQRQLLDKTIENTLKNSTFVPDERASLNKFGEKKQNKEKKRAKFKLHRNQYFSQEKVQLKKIDQEETEASSKKDIGELNSVHIFESNEVNRTQRATSS